MRTRGPVAAAFLAIATGGAAFAEGRTRSTAPASL